MDRELVLNPGDILYREGDTNNCAYIIESGEIVLYTTVEGKRVTCEKRRAGGIVGELSVLTGRRRTVTVEAVTPCRFFEISAEQILNRFDRLDPVLRACIDTSINFTETITQCLNEGSENAAFAPSTLPNAQDVIDQFKMEIDITAGLRRREFSLAYQPIVTLADGEPVGVEALMRWHHPVRGNIPPFRFIEIAEAMGSIGKLTEFALSEACAALGRLKARCPEKTDLYTSVNISGKDVERDGFVDFVAHVLDQNAMNPAHLKLEVTETSLVSDPAAAARRLGQLRDLGCGISVDDFGTGYSNLAYLKMLPLTTLKIDRAFAGDAHANDISRSIVTMMIGLGQHIGVDVVAEGLETTDDVETLLALGCKHAQGYHFCKPVAEPELLDFILARSAVTTCVA